MGEVIFCETNDGSVGLYNEAVGDIYHSTYGAYSESYEKFLKASGFLEYIKEHDKVAILDICYGIGYNTKTALDEIIKLDNTIEVKVDALEYDKNLVNISPFLKHQRVSNEINKFIIKKTNFNTGLSLRGILGYFYKTRGILYINWKNLFLFFISQPTKCVFHSFLSKTRNFLHNIYYNYISSRIKKGQKRPKLNKTSLVFHFNDARQSILKLDTKYNFIFLDAFTPKKLPTLWSYEFFKELYRLLDEDGVLATYSSSAAVRGAMLEAGFCVGTSLDENRKTIGTIAAKKKNLIKYELSEFDLGLLKTRAGIFYRDKNLNASAGILAAQREEEVQNSDRITSSRYKKDYAKKL